MNNGWNEQLRKSLLKNLEKSAKIEQEIIESVVFFDFVTISLGRKKITVPSGVSSENLKTLTGRKSEENQPIEEVWVYSIHINVYGESPEFISANEDSVPGKTLQEFHNHYMEITNTVRRLFWMPFEDIPTALEENFDTDHWINLNFLRNAILYWRLKNG